MTRGRATDRGCALVTGGSRGIGAAIARGLAAEGWPVAVNYLSGRETADELVAEIRAGDGRAVAIGADVTDRDAPDRLLTQAEREFGKPVLVLVNNAGVAAHQLALNTDDEAWRLSVETNLTACFRLIRRVLPSMIGARFGRVVNIGSVTASRPLAGQASYASAKAGLVGLTKAVAVEVARSSVTVNTVAPGFVETELTAGVSKARIAAVPAGRPATVEEVAACACFLASERASYVTGTVLTVDGGFSA